MVRCIDIVLASASVLGMDKMAQLAMKAETGDKWLFAKFAALAGLCTRRVDGVPAALPWERKALDVLAAFGEGEPSTRRDDEERLELGMMCAVMGCFDPVDYARLPRLGYVVTTPAADRDPANQSYALAFLNFPALMMGDYEGAALGLLRFGEILSAGARMHSDKGDKDNSDWCAMNLMVSIQRGEWTSVTLIQKANCRQLTSNGKTQAGWGMFEMCLPLERWSWESLYGANGELCLQAIHNHSFDVYHRSVTMACMGFDPMLAFTQTPRILAVRVATILHSLCHL